jgi:hypothetical protein
MTKAQVVKHFLETYAADCVFCFLVKNGMPDSPHSNVSDCDIDMTDYRQIFRENIQFGKGVCWRCGAAKAFGHVGTTFGNLCENVDLQEFIKPLAYVVLNSPELRQQVFSEIQIDPQYFLTHQLDYARWLGLKAPGSYAKWNHNLFELVYAVAHLVDTKRLNRSNTFTIPPGTTMFPPNPPLAHSHHVASANIGNYQAEVDM